MPTPEPERPVREVKPWNIVLITADTLRGDILPMNGGDVQAPTLTRLSHSATNFTRAYTTFTTTLPAHASLFSSRYALDHGVYNNVSTLDEGLVTLAEQLSTAGYHTAAHVNLPWLNPEVSHLTQGFEEIRPASTIRKADQTSAWAIDFLARQDEQPFFVWLHYIDNHSPYYAPDGHDQPYFSGGPKGAGAVPLSSVWDQFPENHRSNLHFQRWMSEVESVDYIVGTYRGSISWLDSQLAPVFAALQANGQWENTLIVFTADHGESLGDHGLWFVHEGLYEPTVRIPLLIRLPDDPTARSIDAVVSTVDIAPTILAAVGGMPLPDARGEDLWPLIIGQTDGADRVAFIEHLEGRLAGVVSARHKYITHLETDETHPGYPLVEGIVELYDLEADPGEHHNRVLAEPTEARALAAKLAWFQGESETQTTQTAEISPQTREALYSLGYLEAELPALSQAPLQSDGTPSP